MQRDHGERRTTSSDLAIRRRHEVATVLARSV
jgi:hypothetical protein